VNLPDEVKAAINPYFLEGAAAGGKGVVVGAEKLAQLAELFEMYDIDGNGHVDVGEIKLALMENENQYKKRARLGSVVQNDVGEIGAVGKIIEEMAGIGGNGEMNFEQFVEMFHDLF